MERRTDPPGAGMLALTVYIHNPRRWNNRRPGISITCGDGNRGDRRPRQLPYKSRTAGLSATVADHNAPVAEGIGGERHGGSTSRRSDSRPDRLRCGRG